MLIISAVYLWILVSQEVYSQQEFHKTYDDHAEYGNIPPKPCNSQRPGDPDLSVDDIIWSYGFNENHWQNQGVQEIVGSTSYQKAYHFEEYANLTIESARAFPKGVPWEFSFEATFRFPELLPQNSFNLFELTNFYLSPEMSLTINPILNSIEFALPKYDGSLQQVVYEEIEIFDSSWHKVMFGVGQDNVRLWIDCAPIPNANGDEVTALDARGQIDAREGTFSIAQDCQTKQSIPLDLQWMIFSCDKDKPQYTSCDELIYVNPPKNVHSSDGENFPQYERTKSKLPIDLTFLTTTPQSVWSEVNPEGLRSTDSSVCPEQCPMGPRGYPGLRGQKGEPGHASESNALSGLPGMPGLKGERGEVGPAGPPGPSAFITNDNRTLVLPGPKGPPGLQGLPGLPGPKGDSGLPGKTGRDGLHGVMGQQGEKGEPGLPGLKGEQGAMGYSGTDGINGLPGPMGRPGPAGPPGPPGRPGLTADIPNPLVQPEIEPHQIRDICMEVVKDYIAEIASTLVGPPGPPGLPGHALPGAPGPQGIQGEKGMRGEPGERGFTGLPGIPGGHGNAGKPGFPGRKGEPGIDGSGLPGPAGPEGPRGYPGPSTTGKVGKPGSPGMKGDRGDDGLPGLSGQPGQCPDCSSHLAALSYPALYQQQQRNSKGPQNTKGPQEE